MATRAECGWALLVLAMIDRALGAPSDGPHDQAAAVERFAGDCGTDVNHGRQVAKLAGMMRWPGDVQPGFVRFIGGVDSAAGLGLVLPMATGILTFLTPLAALGSVVLQVLVGLGLFIRLRLDDGPAFAHARSRDRATWSCTAHRRGVRRKAVPTSPPSGR